MATVYAVTNPTIARAMGKFMTMAKESSYGTYNNAVYTASNVIFLNAPVNINQPIRILEDRQERYTFSHMKRHTNRYGIGTLEGIDVYIKPAGAASVGTKPHGHQLLESWYGKETVDPGVSVTYEPIGPDSSMPSYSMLVKYGHKVNLLIGAFVKTGQMIGVADDSEGVPSTFTGTIEFARRYWIGKDELSGSEATGQTVISVKNASKFYFGYSASPAVGMKVAFKTVAGVVDDNSGAGYTLAGVDVAANTITISPALAGAGLAANDVVYPFVPDVSSSDVGEPASFAFGVTKHRDGTVTWIIKKFTYNRNNNHVKILDMEQNGSPYPVRKVDAGGNANLREVTSEIEAVMSEDDTDYDYESQFQIEEALFTRWGPDTAGERIKVNIAKVRLDPPKDSGDAEISTVVMHHAMGTDGDDEDNMVFD